MSAGYEQTFAVGFWVFVHREGDDSILMPLVLGKCYPECSGLENWVLRSRELENMDNW